ncbi:hypothetical protein TNCV_3521041 [Trichonephila clavipes]|nr:hypothetical protein TNCV_3521041 [Trichonephila clavipes]
MTKRVLVQRRSGASASFVHVVSVSTPKSKSKSLCGMWVELFWSEINIAITAISFLFSLFLIERVITVSSELRASESNLEKGMIGEKWQKRIPHSGLGLNPGEGMDVCKRIVPLRHGSTLNSRRASSPLVRLVEGEEKWETLTTSRVFSLKIEKPNVFSPVWRSKLRRTTGVHLALAGMNFVGLDLAMRQVNHKTTEEAFDTRFQLKRVGGRNIQKSKNQLIKTISCRTKEQGVILMNYNAVKIRLKETRGGTQIAQETPERQDCKPFEDE